MDRSVDIEFYSLGTISDFKFSVAKDTKRIVHTHISFRHPFLMSHK